LRGQFGRRCIRRASVGIVGCPGIFGEGVIDRSCFQLGRESSLLGSARVKLALSGRQLGCASCKLSGTSSQLRSSSS